MKNVRSQGAIFVLSIIGACLSAHAQVAPVAPPAFQPPVTAPIGNPAQVGDQAGAAAQKGDPALAALNTAQTDLGNAEQNLESVNRRYTAGAATHADQTQAQIAVSEARIRIALLTNESAGALKELETLVALKERLWTDATARYQVGVAPAGETDAARIELAQARIRLELQTIVVAREANLARTKALYEAGVVGKADVEQATQALAIARTSANTY